MTSPLLYPTIALWALSFLCYVLAGVLMWRHVIKRTPHILLTVFGFLADIAAMAMQKILMMQEGISESHIDATLFAAQNVTVNLMMGLYCVVALMGFARIVGWPKLGRWHVPVAVLFMINWIIARAIAWQVMH